jgi:hypothetical protein
VNKCVDGVKRSASPAQALKIKAHGTRTSRSLWTTEEVWYRQNVITGVFTVGIGVIWLVVLGLRTVNS